MISKIVTLQIKILYVIYYQVFISYFLCCFSRGSHVRHSKCYPAEEHYPIYAYDILLQDYHVRVHFLVRRSGEIPTLDVGEFAYDYAVGLGINRMQFAGDGVFHSGRIC